MEQSKTKKNDYVDNAKFLEAILAYKKKLQDARETGMERPRIPEYIGKCFLLIAQNLTNNRRFINYTRQYKEEMICDAMENCIMVVDNFDVEKSRNPFAYFTQICWYAFFRRIIRELKQTGIKRSLFMNSPFMNPDVENFIDQTDRETYLKFVKEFDIFEEKANKAKEKKPKTKTTKKRKGDSTLEEVMVEIE